MKFVSSQYCHLGEAQYDDGISPASEVNPLLHVHRHHHPSRSPHVERIPDETNPKNSQRSKIVETFFQHTVLVIMLAQMECNILRIVFSVSQKNGRWQNPIDIAFLPNFPGLRDMV
jgi:hypothetical protein